ncbi:MAG: hypothetical protein QOG83_3664 [Alphaproteobacteria bacterium]|nr:hypothetical protein [Alphaproteobacteria bacterium]
MSSRWILALVAAGVAAAAPLPAVQAAPKQTQRAQPPDPDLDVEELTPSQIQRAQEPERPNQTPPGKGTPKAAMPNASEPKSAAPKSSPPAPPARAVACSGAFGKDSSHIKLATAFKLDNVTFAEVDNGQGGKVMASVLFPKDPKRRLEVWWENPASRSGTYLIVINGQSTWTAPKGLRLGMQLAAIEKLNGKPIKLKGFGSDNTGQISDWQDGALNNLPGGCKLGVFMRPDAKAPPEARSELSANKEFVSSEANVRAVKPVIAEIIIGY